MRFRYDPKFQAFGPPDRDRPMFVCGGDHVPDELIDDWIEYQIAVRQNPNMRQLRMRHADGRASKTQVRARVEFYGGLCWICRDRPGDCIDHVIPIARGGSKWPSNLRPACRSCNARKADRWPFDRMELVA